MVSAEFMPQVTAMPTIVINLHPSSEKRSVCNLHRAQASPSNDGGVPQMPREGNRDNLHHKEGNEGHQDVESRFRRVLGYLEV